MFKFKIYAQQSWTNELLIIQLIVNNLAIKT